MAQGVTAEYPKPIPIPPIIPKVIIMVAGSLVKAETIIPVPKRTPPRKATGRGPYLSWALPAKTMVRAKVAIHTV